MNVTVMQIVIGRLGTVSKGLKRGLKEMEIGEQAKIIQTTVLLRLARILKRVQETWRDWLLFRLQLKTTS